MHHRSRAISRRVNTLAILPGFHPCINGIMKIPSEHITHANCASRPVSAGGTQGALVSSDAVCLLCRLHVEQIKQQRVLLLQSELNISGKSMKVLCAAD